MFWPVMFEAAGNVGPERAPKKSADIIFGNPYLWGTKTAHTASTADSKPSRQQSADHSSMSLMSMLQSPTEVGPRAALLQHYNVVINPRIYFFSIFLSCTSTQKKVARRREPQKKNHVRTSALKKKKMHMEGNSTSPAPACSIWPVMSVK